MSLLDIYLCDLEVQTISHLITGMPIPYWYETQAKSPFSVDVVAVNCARTSPDAVMAGYW